MVFSHLQAQEKEAFFSLLDEYFSSRPDIFANVGTPDASSDLGARGAAASAVHRALASNPETTAKLVSAGLKHGLPKDSPYAAAATNPDVNAAAGRVAAASLAFSARNPPSSSAPPPVSEKPSSSVMSSARKFGSDVDTSSIKNAFGSLRNAASNKAPSPTSPPPAPSAFSQRQGAFGTPGRKGPDPSAHAPPPPPPPPPPRHQEEEEEEEPQGEWAEVLYDYESAEAGDLNIRENQQVLVTDRTSADWWTGELDGKTGLFPASYVKLL